MIKIIVPVFFLMILIVGSSQLLGPANAQDDDFTLTLNPGAINSGSQNPITPANITVPAGTNVTWINKDSSPHMIVSGNPEEGPDNIFYGDFFATDENYTVTFDNPGLYPYYYPAWSHIRGQITVEDVAFPSELDSSENDSSVEGLAGSLVSDSSENDSSVEGLAGSLVSDSSENDSSVEGLAGSLEQDLNLSTVNESSGNEFQALDEGKTSSFPSSSLSSLGSDQSLRGLFEQIGPLLGLFMNGTNSTSPSPLSSLLQSNGPVVDRLMDLTNVRTHDLEDVPYAEDNSGSLLNETFTTQNGSLNSLVNERAAVQAELINVLKKAYSIGAQLPELPSSYDDDNATIFVKLNVINPIDKGTNATYLSASDFSLSGQYQTGPGSSGTTFGPVNDAGRIFTLPASNYSIIEDTALVGMEPRDSLLQSYSTSYSKGCSGQIDYMESKDCIITKTYTNVTGNNSTNPLN